MQQHINRRSFIKAGGAVIGASLLSRTWADALSSVPGKRPNFVVILADDLGYCDIGCYGGEVETPHLDAMARNGLRFTNFCNDAVCTASRACLLTGLYTRENNHGDMIHSVTFAEALKTGGYSCWYSGKWHTKGLPSQRGFNRTFAILRGAYSHLNFGKLSPQESYQSLSPTTSFDMDGVIEKNFQSPKDLYSSDIFTDYALKFLNEHRTDQPFCLHLCFTAPHYPLQARAADIAKYRGRFMKGWSALHEQRLRRLKELGLISGKEPVSAKPKDVRDWDSLSAAEKTRQDEIMAVYAAMVDRIDWNVGRVMDALRQKGVADNTIVIFLSDNGSAPGGTAKHADPATPIGGQFSYYSYDKGWAWLSAAPFNGFKGAAYKGGVTTPMIVHWPAGLRHPGGICRETGHFIDFLPTFIDFAGVKYPREMNGAEVYPSSGISFRPLLEGKSRRAHEAIYWGFHNPGIQEGNWKAIVPLAWQQINALNRKLPVEEQIAFQRTMWINSNWHLFDLETDPFEAENVAAKYPDRLKALKAKWQAWSDACEKRLGAEYRPHPPSQIAL